MPTFNQCAFLHRAIESLCAQTLTDWELLAVDDGSTDGTSELLAGWKSHPRIRIWRMEENRGFAAALNFALDRARGELIAYLPSDDVYYRDHLASLARCLDTHPDAVLAYAGIRFQQRLGARGKIPGLPLQLVQTMHRRGAERWIEREELVTDDLDRLFWRKLRERGEARGTGRITCEWVDHPAQQHKAILEPLSGGLNPYRTRYRVPHPLRFQSSRGDYVDEVEQYRRFRERPATPAAEDGLKILLVGELAFNPERILALEERGHRLYGLWISKPWWFNTVGPLPFGHVEDLSPATWKKDVRRLGIDLIYALLNWQAVPLAHEVLQSQPGIPLVWHFKEGPWLCMERGTWPQLVDLVTRSSGQIYSSAEERDWFAAAVPATRDGLSLALDGDLPKREWFTHTRAPRLSADDGEFHTVVPGRPVGLPPVRLRELAREKIHLHFYGNVQQAAWRQWIEEAQAMGPGYLHLHPYAGPDRWVEEFSRYDAGWLHFLRSRNKGDIAQAFWDDLNLPARMAPLAAAGLPLIQYDNRGSIVAAQALTSQLQVGIFAKSIAELGTHLRDAKRMEVLRSNMWRERERFSFDYHADRLIEFFRQVIQTHHGRRSSGHAVTTEAGAD
ncbi:MAG TPA: glycosyltransferase [Bryobacteraceae bacterium]|nr:glycosyltransferase [Bryobacteraceae bacterium]